MSAHFENRALVVPGDILYEGRIRAGNNTYRMGGKVYATHVGLVEYGRGVVSVIALEAGYTPMVGDTVIGYVVDIDVGQWIVDINAPMNAVLKVPDAMEVPFTPDLVMTDFLDVGDTIVAKVVDLDRKRTPILSILGGELGRVDEGLVVEMTPSKVPRLIGKKGSMVSMILKETGCRLVIGENGRILIQCANREDEELIVSIIRKIEREAHTTGLTNRVHDYIMRMRGVKNG